MGKIDKLIDCASRGKLDILETLYHDDMKIYMLSKGGENTGLQIIDKPGFIAHLNDTIKGGDFPNTWASFHVVEADEKHGLVVISRKTNLGTEGKVISLSIDFVFEVDFNIGQFTSIAAPAPPNFTPEISLISFFQVVKSS